MKKLLVIDDDLHNRVLVKTYAEADDFQCVEAENGLAGLRAIEEDAFDIIVLDVMMPGMPAMNLSIEAKAKTRF